MKVLHVVESLDRGAVETWLVRMLAHATRNGMALDWTFYCTLSQRGDREEEVRNHGAKVVASKAPLTHKFAFVRGLRRVLRERYDVIHCHHDLVSALYLLASVGLGVRRRLIHVHNADEAVLTPSALKARIYKPLLRLAGMAFADRIVGISDHTLDTYLRRRPRRPGRDVVHYYGVDPASFRLNRPEPDAFRRSLSLPLDARILLFGGRVVPEKNPVFVVDVLEALRTLDPRAVAVFAGAGSLEESVRQRAVDLGVESAVRMLGWRSDLPYIMRNSDWFILPRPEEPKEGFGLAVVEAQLAGLPVLASVGVPEDPFLPGANFRRLRLSDPPVEWAKACMLIGDAPRFSSEAALAALAASPMDMDRALDGLLSLYE